MASSPLLICPSCERHVRIVDSSCPFCGLGLSEAMRASLALKGPGRRLGRAAFYAFSMGTMTFAAACSSSSTMGGEGDAGTDSKTDACVCPPYGQPAYGAPGDARALDVHPSDGTTTDVVSDAESGDANDGGGVLPPYGHPPFDGGEGDTGSMP
jgi:hypothetical protein